MPTTTSTGQHNFRVYIHEGKLSETKDENSGIKRSLSFRTASEAQRKFAEEYTKWTSAPHFMTSTKEMLSRWLGSNILTKRLLECQAKSGEVSTEVRYLADCLWKEAMGELDQLLTVPVKSISLGKVEKAESVLLKIKRALLNKGEKNEEELTIEDLSKQFHKLIPHRAETTTDVNSIRVVAKKQDLCQLIQDVINVNEALGWKKQPSAVSKYRAMRCFIEHLDNEHPEFKDVEQLVLSTASSTQDVSIVRIFAVSRALDEFRFDRSIGNERLLMHASKAPNFLGILSRGILLPKIVVEMFGIKRWDAGMLGSGVYFGDATSTSAKYSTPARATGTRFMAISNVALGKIKKIFEKRLDLERAPPGFDSVHGVSNTHDVESFFKDDEYVVYKANQHCLRFLVEFRLEDKHVDQPDLGKVNVSPQMMSVDDNSDDSDSDSDDDIDIDTTDVQGMVHPEAKLKAGLSSSGEHGNVIQLKAVHVRAKIVDLAAEVTVLQKYENIGDETAETRYVFPLDDRAAVCGFEAYINGKHVVGEVKEKEQAKRSFQKAVKEGHGAYLMEQEAANVFSITVGNLPPKSCVVVRITYVTELVVEGQRIAFNLLGSVAPWKKKAILDSKYDDHGETVAGVVENQTERNESFRASITMPCHIRRVDCPTHSINIRRVNEKEMDVAMCDGDRLIDGFQLLIDMEDAHRPRIWREKHPNDENKQACMVVFYPEFPVTTIDNPEVVIMLDRSTSMKGEPMRDAKKLVHMILENLPIGSRYNLIIFGNDFEERYPESVLATERNIQETESFLKDVSWERGATEVWRPLRAMALMYSDDIRLTRNGFLISDGHVTNEQDTLMSVATNRHINRLFTFGVSSESNRHVLRTLADTGGGAYEHFDPRSKSTWEAKIQAQVRRSCQPAATSIKVNWIPATSDSETSVLTRKQIVQAPSQIASIFTGSRLVLFGMGPEISEVQLDADIEGRDISLNVTADKSPASQGMLLHRLATRGMVRDWEIGSVHANRLENDAMMDDVRRLLVQLGIEYNIVSPLTSFVAVEKRDDENETGKGERSVADLLEEISSRRDCDATTSSLDQSWQSQQASTGIESRSTESQIDEILTRARGAQKSFSYVTAQHQFQQAMELAASLPPTDQAVQEASLALAQFHLHIQGEPKLAYEVLSQTLIKIRQATPSTDDIDRRLSNMAKICEGIVGDSQLLRKMEHGVQRGMQTFSEGAQLTSKDDIHDVRLSEEEVAAGEIPGPSFEERVLVYEARDVSPDETVIEEREDAVASSADSPVMLQASRAESPVMLHAVREDSPVMLQRIRDDSPVMLMEERADSPVMLMEKRAVSPVMVQASRAESPVMLEATRPASPVMLQASRAESPVMLHALREDSPVMLMDERAVSPVMMQASRAESPVMLQASRAESPVMVMEQRIIYPVAMRALSPEVAEEQGRDLCEVKEVRRVYSDADVDRVLEVREVRVMSPVQPDALAFAPALPEEDVGSSTPEKQRVEDTELHGDRDMAAVSPVMMQASRAYSQKAVSLDSKVMFVEERTDCFLMEERTISPVMMRALSPEVTEESARDVIEVREDRCAYGVADIIEVVEVRELRELSPVQPDALAAAPALPEEDVGSSAQEKQRVEDTELRGDRDMAAAKSSRGRGRGRPSGMERRGAPSSRLAVEDDESLLSQPSLPVSTVRPDSPVMRGFGCPYRVFMSDMLQQQADQDKEREAAEKQRPRLGKGSIDDAIMTEYTDCTGSAERRLVRRFIKIAREDDDGWWTWAIADIAKEFDVDCGELLTALIEPQKSIDIDASLAAEWMRLLDTIDQIVSAVIVVCVVGMTRMAEGYRLSADNDPDIVELVLPQAREWMEYCLPSDVIWLGGRCFGGEIPWEAETVAKFLPIEGVIKSILGSS